MKSYRFEIVRRRYGRYGWRAIAIDDDDDRPRLLARSERSYRSPQKVERVVAALQDAEVVDVSGDGDDGDAVSLPGTRFEVVSGVLPLIVAEHPDPYAPAAPRRRARAKVQAAQLQAGDDDGDGDDEQAEGKRKGRRRGRKAE